MRRTGWMRRPLLAALAVTVAVGLGTGCGEAGTPEAGDTDSAITGETRADAGDASADGGVGGADGGADGGAGGGMSDAGEALGYRDLVAPIFYGACTGCHEYGSNALNLDPHVAVGQLVNVQAVACADGRLRVKPGSADPKDSYLMAKLLGTDLCSGGVMPPSGALSADQIAIVGAWIEGGAQP